MHGLNAAMWAAATSGIGLHGNCRTTQSFFPRRSPRTIGPPFHFHTSLRRIPVNPSGQCCLHLTRLGERHILRPSAAEGQFDIAVPPSPGNNLFRTKSTRPHTANLAALAGELDRPAVRSRVTVEVQVPCAR